MESKSLVKPTMNTTADNNSTNSSLLLGFLPPPISIPSIVFLSALVPVICAGNMMVILIFVKYQRIRTPTNSFLFSLALSDLAVGLIIIPFWIGILAVQFDISETVRSTYTVLDITCSVASMANLACVSIERFYGVTYPFHHMNLTVKKAALGALCAWIYGFCLALLYLINETWVFTILSILGLFVPFIVIIVCYCGIVRTIRHKKPPCGDRPTQEARENKTIRTLFIVTCIYIICWFPFVIGSLIANHCESCVMYIQRRPFLQTSPKLLHLFNSAVNPILYALLSPSFKSAYRQLLFGQRRFARGSGSMNRPQRLSMDPSNTNISVIRKSNVGFQEKNKINNGSIECLKHMKIIQNNNDGRESRV